MINVAHRRCDGEPEKLNIPSDKRLATTQILINVPETGDRRQINKMFHSRPALLKFAQKLLRCHTQAGGSQADQAMSIDIDWKIDLIQEIYWEVAYKQYLN